jgi:dUTP pyrophosphatase
VRSGTGSRVQLPVPLFSAWEYDGAVQPRVLIKKLRPDAIVPRYMTAGAAGMDLCAALDAPVALAPGARAAITTGIAVAIAPGFEGQVRPRSGLARDHGVTCVNAPGTIDCDYTGPVIVTLINHGAEPVTIESGHRIAQLVIAPVVQAELVEVDELPATARGAGGFGSTGR